MGLSNDQIVRLMISKGLIQSSDLDNGGKLNPVQANRFIDYVVSLTMLDKFARVVRFRNEQMFIDKITVGRRVTVPAEEAKDPGVRRGVVTSQVPLQPVELMTPFELSDTFQEHNIEGDAIEDHVARMMADQMGNDVEQLYIEGDTLGPAALESDLYEGGDTTRVIKDSLLGKFNGWLRKADSGHLFDAEGSAVSLHTFSQALIQMPTKFKKNLSRLRFLCPQEIDQMYRERYATRSTAGGDAAANSSAPMTPFGIPLVPVPLLPLNPTVVEHKAFTAGSTVTLRYNNIVDGSVVITPTSLNKIPTTPYVETTDYTVDETAGTVTQVGSQLGGSVTVKITYKASPQIILTHQSNLIAAIGREVRIERDRDIFSRLNQWAITTKVDCQFEETDAIVKITNLASSL
jgi:hypothetical protein